MLKEPLLYLFCNHLEEADPLEVLLLPLGGQAAAVQQSVHIPVSVRLGLDLKGGAMIEVKV